MAPFISSREWKLGSILGHAARLSTAVATGVGCCGTFRNQAGTRYPTAKPTAPAGSRTALKGGTT